MAKRINLKSGLGSILFWSIISAAFIGPGTVTTASKAGASFGLGLMWALTFSIIATILLQEAAARITIASGKSLGVVIAQKYGRSGSWLKILLFLAVAFGCAAYQAGNILGALSGLFLITSINKVYLVLGLGLIAGALLWLGRYRTIANFMGLIVAFMGILFIVVAFNTDVSLLEVGKAAFLPSWNEEGSLLIISLIGTTIVPYNLFLASGISKGQDLNEMRFGLGLAILIGGIISIAIMIVGTQIQGAFSFENLSATLEQRLGEWSASFFAIGLFAAGLTSSITAPLAAAVTAQSLFGNDQKEWRNQGINFRLVWGSILAIGLLFSLTNIQPIPAIIAAQAINGVLLPIIAIFLVTTMNDAHLLPKAFINNIGVNILMLFILLVCCFLGFNNLFKAIQRIGILTDLSPQITYLSNIILSSFIVVLVGIKIFSNRKGSIK